MRNRHLIVLLVLVVAAVVLVRGHSGLLPWNQGQAGSIFDGRYAGGGQ